MTNKCKFIKEALTADKKVIIHLNNGNMIKLTSKCNVKYLGNDLFLIDGVFEYLMPESSILIIETKGVESDE